MVSATASRVVRRAGLLDRLHYHLHRRVAVKRIGLRLEAGVAELLHDIRRSRVVAGVRPEGVQHALGSRAGDGGELGGHDAVARDELRLQSGISHLTDDLAGLGVEAAEVGRLSTPASFIFEMSAEKSLSPAFTPSYMTSVRPAAFIAFLVSSARPCPYGVLSWMTATFDPAFFLAIQAPATAPC